jgi:hypothetical protein
MRIKNHKKYDERPDYYVYAHLHPKTNDVFYIGKGKGNRHKDIMSRNSNWVKYVDEIGEPYKILMVKDSLDEFMAGVWEERIISKLGTIHDGGILVNSVGSRIHPGMGVPIGINSGLSSETQHPWVELSNEEIIEDLLAFPNMDIGEDFELGFETLYEQFYDNYDKFEEENEDAFLDVEMIVGLLWDDIDQFKHSNEDDAKENIMDMLNEYTEELKEILEEHDLTQDFEDIIKEIINWIINLQD